MNALPQPGAALPRAPVAPTRIAVDDLAACVRALDPGSRALLDLSLRRRLPFEAMAGVLRTDPFDLARRRARAVARIAAELDLEGAGVVATVKAALARLPDDAWGVPVKPAAPAAPRLEPPEVAPQPVALRAVQAESMAEAARALMENLRAVREDAAAAAPDPAEQPTVETEAIVLPPEPAADAWPAVAATPMAAAYSHHPAFAIEREDEETVDAAALPPLAEALARAADSERAAAAEAAAPPAPVVEEAPPIVEPTPAPPVAPPPVVHEPHRRLARGGLLVGLLLAIVRLLLGRR